MIDAGSLAAHTASVRASEARNEKTGTAPRAALPFREHDRPLLGAGEGQGAQGGVGRRDAVEEVQVAPDHLGREVAPDQVDDEPVDRGPRRHHHTRSPGASNGVVKTNRATDGP